KRKFFQAPSLPKRILYFLVTQGKGDSSHHCKNAVTRS
uniref:Uncharacterized protein n=1 Tax=Aegilops tauschii subsp. strangulata TaxID=200361 RepID=A0A453G0A8_AEGTS